MFDKGGLNDPVNSVSGRLLNLSEMFHIGDSQSEIFQVSPYDGQLGRIAYELTGKMTVKNNNPHHTT